MKTEIVTDLTDPEIEIVIDLIDETETEIETATLVEIETDQIVTDQTGTEIVIDLTGLEIEIENDQTVTDLPAIKTANAIATATDETAMNEDVPKCLLKQREKTAKSEPVRGTETNSEGKKRP